MKLKFQRIILSLSLLSSGYVFADGILPESLNHRFYFGGTLGLASLMDKESTDVPISDVHYLSAAGVLLGPIIGYEFNPYRQLKIGIEWFANGSSLTLADNQNYAPQSSYTVTQRYSSGFRILPGYEFTPGTDGHLILGYSYGSFNIKDTGNYGLINQNFSKNGFQYGLGIGAFLSSNLTARTDVIYTTYSSQSSTGVTTSTPATSQNYQNNLSTLEGDLTLIYKV